MNSWTTNGAQTQGLSSAALDMLQLSPSEETLSGLSEAGTIVEAYHPTDSEAARPESGANDGEELSSTVGDSSSRRTTGGGC